MEEKIAQYFLFIYHLDLEFSGSISWNYPTSQNTLKLVWCNFVPQMVFKLEWEIFGYEMWSLILWNAFCAAMSLIWGTHTHLIGYVLKKKIEKILPKLNKCLLTGSYKYKFWSHNILKNAVHSWKRWKIRRKRHFQKQINKKNLERKLKPL